MAFNNKQILIRFVFGAGLKKNLKIEKHHIPRLVYFLVKNFSFTSHQKTFAVCYSIKVFQDFFITII